MQLESGGPSGGGGFYYQNSLAVMFLGQMLSPGTQSPGEKIGNVRLEAPTVLPNEERVKTFVDDIVITFADGHREFIQVKGNIQTTGETWEKLWKDFQNQLETDFNKSDRLVLYLGTHDKKFDMLMVMCERARESEDVIEWKNRNNKQQAKIFESVNTILTSADEQIKTDK